MIPHDIVKGVTTLFSLPEVCIRVNEMTENPNYSAQDIGAVISQDTGLTARILRMANSPFYSHTARIDTITRAITVIGVRELRDLVLATTTVRTFARLPSELIDMDAFWRHSITTGVIAQILAGKCRVLHSERLFIAGLLHDVGRLVMCQRIPELVKVIMARARATDQVMHLAEVDVLEFNHGEVGAELMGAWRLPPALHEVAEFHHTPRRSERFPLEVAIVHLANIIATQHADTNEDGIEDFDPWAWELTGLSERIVDRVMIEAHSKVSEAEALLLPRTRLAQ